MSANNWRHCRHCDQVAAETHRKRIDKAKKQYGKITPEAFIELMAKVNQPAEDNEETLRENYEFWQGDDNSFNVSYRASCDKCGFTFSFKHSEPFVNQSKQ